MNKLEVMEQMSQRISDKCAAYDFCEDCILHKYNCDENERWCGDYSDEEDYNKLKIRCGLLKINIADLVSKQSIKNQSDSNKQKEKYNMKLFKSVDDKLKDLGFDKNDEDKYGVSYSRVISINENNKYTHNLDILHKDNGNHIIQSYEEELNNDGFNNMVGLAYKETKLAMKKYRQLKRKYKWK